MDAPTSNLNPQATPFLPGIASLPSLPDAALTSTLDLLFEPSPQLHALTLPMLRTLSFGSYADLIATLRDQLLAMAAAVSGPHADPDARRPLHAILASHPRLGPAKPPTPHADHDGNEEEEEQLSAQSAAEQAQLRGGDHADARRLAALNDEYEAAFPGLRYVVFVNGRPRDVIMADMRRRIDRADPQAEEREAIQAMCDIAADRAAKLQKSSPEAGEHCASAPARV
ncbi:Oxo-4-hydroxy-4-carboxy-5-ureidoimidazoline decarboxylase [Lasiosphaeria miniovina]|uniref:Oxo-4-hydroxy-4-carboxy-5-ureidoimidazoline decarboxylase n=1 Tax=Lasiosphaeria miniovina TaxID=1954250 RepID=A0AA39ZUQ0_9PEZI|nr:Oxo-4-hydroxy-4-carboxy-5-ureidoimidazoline decarboxylase [Lasiosphaeria miniovina]KAK0704008.1 Oxo-4-hydroxy-4-carboxy-5-ureidoimidazoline decarboxylase [Lasiosphaeria miniovina]